MFMIFGFLGFLIPVALVVGVIYFLVRVSRDVKDESALTVKEVIVDTGIFLSLITSIVSLVSIIFSAIDKKFIDVLKGSGYGSDTALNDDVRVSVAVILVVFPIYLALAYYKARYMRDNASRRSVPAMKYVNYITLGFAAMFVVGSMVTTIYEYLGGELGQAFFYKILTVVAMSIALGAYNYYSLKRDYDAKSNLPHIFAIISLVAVVASVVYSINILGSPTQVRKIKFDEKRLTDLSNVQQEILNYWTRMKTLPSNLSDLQGDGFNSSFVMPKDPKTKDSYTYKVIDNSKMVKAYGQDCATFYPSKFNNYNNNGNYNVASLSCEIPTKATFEICATFETVRAYDENGIDQSAIGWDASNAYGVRGIDSMSAKYSDTVYYDTYTKNPNWNHDKGSTCFKRTIDPMKYPSYN